MFVFASCLSVLSSFIQVCEVGVFLNTRVTFTFCHAFQSSCVSTKPLEIFNLRVC